MTTENEILHLRAKFDAQKGKLARGEIKEKSFRETRANIRRQAKDTGIDPDLVAPIEGKAEREPEKHAGAISPEKIVDVVSRALTEITESVPLARISTVQEIQQRASHVAPELRAEYAEAMRQGATFPPVVVFGDPDSKFRREGVCFVSPDAFFLADGFTRVGAAEDAGLTEILATVREGGYREALLYAVGANAEHGARRTTADKTRAVETLLSDEEWSSRSDRWIAETAKVSAPFVAKVRETLTVNATVSVYSQVDAETVKSLSNRLADLPAPPSKPLPKPRTGRDGRTTNTAAIGAKKKSVPKAPELTAKDGQQAIHRFGAACAELYRVEKKFEGPDIANVVRHARDVLIHFMLQTRSSDLSFTVEKIREAAREVLDDA